MDFGSTATENGVGFALWAPDARAVSVIVEGKEYHLTRRSDGFHAGEVRGARPGDLYLYHVDGALDVPDPASRFQPFGLPGPSQVVDPGTYQWRRGSPDLPWEEAVIWEAHVGTATPEGTFAALAGCLPDLRRLGVTALELMPVAERPGKRNWGYDGVLPFAPHSTYGTPDDLKGLIDEAHGFSLIVLLDVVYNHFGPAGNHLGAYAKSFFAADGCTPWGTVLNWEGPEAAPVRRFFIDNALYWLNEYRFDGLRFDAVHHIRDASRIHFLDELVDVIRRETAGRQIHLILENEANHAHRLNRDTTGTPRTYTAQWNDDIHNAWHVLLSGETDGYYEDFVDAPIERLARALSEGFSYQGEISRRLGVPRGEPSAHLPPQCFVAFLQNHDQIGNRAFGERLCHIIPEQRLALARTALLLSPQIPMLFMGEEWSASAPFLFFVDFPGDESLQEAVREGRRREFGRFPSFARPDIPDPNSWESFLSSRVDWSERAREPHARILADTAELIVLRQRHVVPLLKSRYRGSTRLHPTPETLDLAWHFEAGDLRLVANFGENPIPISDEGDWTTVRRTGPPSCAGYLPPWACIIFTNTSQ